MASAPSSTTHAKLPLSGSHRVAAIEERFVPEVGSEPFPGYRLVRLRGSGGFATVWEATAPSGQRVAIKFMSSQTSNSTAREIRLIAALHKLSHQHLLKTGQVWSIPGWIAIEMALAEASLLDLFLLYAEEFRTVVDPNKVALYLFQAAQALDFLNARKHSFEGKTVGFVHGDIKPNNILIFGDEVRLADYGLATPLNGPYTTCSRQGTLDYAAPEVFSHTVTEHSDQFGLAVTYALLRTGTFPFPPVPRTPPKGYARPAPDVNGLLPEEQPVVFKALSPVPQNRYANCVEFMTAAMKAIGLEPLQTETNWIVQPIPGPGSSTRSQMVRSALRQDAAK
jgi:serine/threonine protein kinase, bacterial